MGSVQAGCGCGTAPSGWLSHSHKTPRIQPAHNHSAGRKDEGPLGRKSPGTEHSLPSPACVPALVWWHQGHGMSHVVGCGSAHRKCPRDAGETSPFRWDWESATCRSCSCQGTVTQGPVSSPGLLTSELLQVLWHLPQPLWDAGWSSALSAFGHAGFWGHLSSCYSSCLLQHPGFEYWTETFGTVLECWGPSWDAGDSVALGDGRGQRSSLPVVSRG